MLGYFAVLFIVTINVIIETNNEYMHAGALFVRNLTNETYVIHHSPYIVDFRSAGCYHTITGRLQIFTRAARQAFRVASLLAGSTSSRPFFCFLCNLRSIHDAQGTDARPCEVSHRYVKSPHQPLRFDVEEGATLNYYNRPKSGPTTSPEGVNDIGGMVYSQVMIRS